MSSRKEKDKIAISLEKKRGNVYLIKFASGEEFECPLELIYEFAIEPKKKLSPSAFEKFQKKSEIYFAKAAAYDFVSYRPRSEKETREKLAKKNFSKNAIDAAVDFLVKNELLDDEKFARAWTRDASRLKKRGKFRIINELLKKGIAKNIREKVVEEEISEETEIENAFNAARKKIAASAYKSKPVNEQKRLIKNYLFRQGFSRSVVEKAISRLY